MIAGKQILEALRDKIVQESSVKTILEPDPLDYGYEPVLRLNPSDWDFDQAMGSRLVTLKVVGSLEASGDDAGVFLSDAMNAHLSLLLWANPEDGEPLELAVGDQVLPIEFQVIPGPALQRNDEEGKKPFLYQKTFDLGLSILLSALRS